MRSDVFAINIPNVDLISAVHFCGMKSGNEGDKFAAAKLTPIEALEIEAPLVGECVAHIECGMHDRITFGDHDLFVGRVLTVVADDQAFNKIWDVASDATKSASKAIAEALKPYAKCRVGVALTFGGGDLAQGQDIANTINQILADDFPDLFGDAGLENFAFVDIDKLNLVTIQMYFFRGCDGPRERTSDG